MSAVVCVVSSWMESNNKKLRHHATKLEKKHHGNATNTTAHQKSYLVPEDERVEAEEQEGDHCEECDVLDPGMLQHRGHWRGVPAQKKNS